MHQMKDSSLRCRLAAASARGAGVALAAVLAFTASVARAQSIADVPINDSTAIFCRDNTGTPVMQTYANLGGVMRRYQQRFQFGMSVQPGDPLKVVFSDPATTPYAITYDVQPYRDDAGRKGILLLSMHLYLDGTDRDVTGSAMCFFTEYGK
jgi:hypothetical protein